MPLLVERVAESAPIGIPEAVSVAAFRATLRTFLRRSEQIARQSGLTPQRHLLLLMIKGAPNGSGQATVSDLAQRLKLAQSTVTELVKRTEDAGLIERERSRDDARVAHLRLTGEGERRLGLAFRAHDGERAELIRACRGLDGRGRRMPRGATSPGQPVA